MTKTSIILGIDTSCDDTCAAIVENGNVIHSNVLSRQDEFHHRFGGVVPEIASRKHIELMEAVIAQSLEKACLHFDDLNGVAVTWTPGLIGALVVGLSSAKSIAYAKGIPLVPVNHVHAHVYSLQFHEPPPQYPLVALVVSGGHNLLILARGPLDLQYMGTTVDDAAGEAFDKVAKLCGLGYPGGPVISKLAETGDTSRYKLPRPKIHHNDLDFSFSGLKTAVKRLVEKEGSHLNMADLAAGVQAAIVEVLVYKTIKAAREAGVRQIGLAGGVAANSKLRGDLETAAAENGLACFCAPRSLCMDNAVMIAGLGYHLLKAGVRGDFDMDGQASVYLRSEDFYWKPIL